MRSSVDFRQDNYCCFIPEVNFYCVLPPDKVHHVFCFCFDIAVRSVFANLAGTAVCTWVREYCNNGPYVYVDTITTDTSILRILRYNIWLGLLLTVCPLTKMTVNLVENKPEILFTIKRGQPWRSLAIEKTRPLYKPAMGETLQDVRGQDPRQLTAK